MTEVSPACRLAGSFTGRGRPGVNRVSFRGRVRGRVLEPGTYRIAARVPGQGTVLRVTLVIVRNGMPTPTELALAQRSNVCASARSLATNASRGELGATATRSASRPSSKTTAIVRHQTKGVSTSRVHDRAHASAFSPARISENARNPFVIFALGAAVLLLGLAALPKAAVPDPRLTDVLARHRLEVALAGAAALALGVLALTLA